MEFKSKYFRLSEPTVEKLKELQQVFSRIEGRNVSETEVVTRCIQFCHSEYGRED